MNTKRPLLLALFLLLATTVLLLWAPWRAADPGNASEPSGSSTTEKGDPRTRAAREPPDTADLGERAAEAVDEKNDRELLPPDVHSSVRGAFLSPRGAWPGGGTVSLVPAASQKDANPMSMFTLGLEQARRARQRELAGKKKVGDNATPDYVLRMFGMAPPVATAAVDDRGTFVIDNPSEGRFELRLNHTWLATELSPTVSVVNGHEVDVGVVPTRAAAGLLVVVADAQGQPIPDANLTLHHPIDRGKFMQPGAAKNMVALMRQVLPQSARTDDRGVHLFAGIDPDERWNIEAYHKNFVKEFRTVELIPGRQNLMHIEMHQGVDLEVAVVKPGGEPCARAKVRVIFRDYRYPKGYQKPAAGGRPDPFSKSFDLPTNGRRVLDGLLAGHATVRVQAVGYFPAEKEVTLRTTGENDALRFELEEGVAIRGVILDEQRKPIEGARVLPIGDKAKGPLGIDLSAMVTDILALDVVRNGVPSDADGNFRIGGFEQGQAVRLMALAKGYDIAQTSTVRAGATKLEIRLRKLASVRGVVVADQDGAAVPAFAVKLEERAFLVVDKTVASEEFHDRKAGTFELADAPRGNYAVTIEAAGFSPFRGRVDLSEGSADLGTIRLPPPSGVEGTVVNPAGDPVEGAAITLVRGGLMDQMALAGGFGDQVETDAKGAFRLSPLQGRRVRLLVRKKGLAPLQSKSIALRRGEVTKGIVLRLTAGGSLHGVLRDQQGNPLPEWRVQASHTRGAGLHVTKTDAEGRFVFEGLAAGAHKVECFSIENMSKMQAQARTGIRSARDLSGLDIGKLIVKAMRNTVSERIVIREGETQEIELTFRGGDEEEAEAEGLVRVQGEVHVGDTPLENGMVFFAPAGSTSLGQVAQVKAGKFELERVEPGTYRARVQAGVLSGTLGTPQVVEVKETESGTFPLRLELPGGELRGRIVSADGTTPVVGAVLSLSRRGGQGPTLDTMEFGEGTVLSKKDGSFAFRGLQAGEYGITAKETHSKEGGVRRSARESGLKLEARESRTGLVIRVQTGGSLRVDVADSNGPRRNAMVTLLAANGQPTRLFPRSLTDKDGAVSWSGLPEGSYRVSVDAPQAAPRVSDAVPVAAGASQRIAVTLDVGIPVEVRAGEGTTVKPGERVLYTIWRSDGVRMRSGSLTVPPTGSKWRIGRFAPGRYRVRIESSTLGVIDRQQEVPAKGVGVWVLTK